MFSELDSCRATDRPGKPGNQSKIIRIVDPLSECSGAKELDKFLESLWSNIASHMHLFPRGDSDQVKYVVIFLDNCNNYPDLTQ